MLIMNNVVVLCGAVLCRTTGYQIFQPTRFTGFCHAEQNYIMVYVGL